MYCRQRRGNEQRNNGKKENGRSTMPQQCKHTKKKNFHTHTHMHTRTHTHAHTHTLAQTVSQRPQVFFVIECADYLFFFVEVLFW